MNHPALPTKELLLHACRAEPREDHPLLRCVHLLAGLHERDFRNDPAVDDIAIGRARLVYAIDHWVATRLPVARGGAHMHTETLGSVLDRLARHSAYAHAILAFAPKWQMHEAWEHLADLALGYEDLAIDLKAGARRLPPFPGSRADRSLPPPSVTALEMRSRRSPRRQKNPWPFRVAVLCA
ncbi:DUF4254 domain-containing protein [Nocardia sp. NPDC050697]|uniref:DUF4254 domain-containing protein n=1 Tax=Nocardia sp. NPDC050697 TaxID=3155158 RepID=UPI00340F6E6F